MRNLQTTPWRPSLALAIAGFMLAAACNSGPGNSQNSTSTTTKESNLSATGTPPGPPGPPGPPPAPGSETDDVTRYQAYLSKAGQANAADLHEEKRWRAGDWRFYYRGQPTNRTDEVALDSAGNAVSAGDKASYGRLISAPGLDADGAHKRLAWLMGRAAPITSTYKLKDPAAAAKLADPALTRAADGSATFTGWLVYPPNMQTPYRIVVKADKNGVGTVEHTVWNKL